MGCIAMGPELWFERLGFPLRPLPRARRAGRLTDATLEAGGARASGLRSAVRQAGQSLNLVEGATLTMLVFKRLTALAVIILAGVAAGAAWAGDGQPSPWQLGFQQSATEVMDRIDSFHHFLLWIISAITAFVLILLVIVMWRFNARANPVPSRTTHNTLIEVLWTVIPIAILMVIAVPSFKLLFLQLNIPAADLTVKATGKQWYWTYSYPDHGKFEFDSLLVRDEKQLKAGQPRLLTVDNEMVVPVNKVVRVLTTGAEVIHAFAVPSFGIKADTIPGRINETWFKATREGVYHGQCSELCGKDHAYMPIAVRVVSEQAFATWVEEAKKKYAREDTTPPTNVAAADQTTVR
jgi:cytochrome c oxidase subunit 2